MKRIFGRAAAAPSAENASSDKLKRRIAELEQANKRLRSESSSAAFPVVSGSGGGGGPAQGKGKGGKKNQDGSKSRYNPNIPKPLQGKNTKTADGRNICFN